MKLWRDDGRARGHAVTRSRGHADNGVVLRGKLLFALLWTGISAFAIRAVIREPLPGDEWLLILVGLLVLSSLALLLDVLVRYVHSRRVDSPPPDS